MGQTRSSDLPDEKTPLLAKKQATVASIDHPTTMSVKSVCAVNSKLSALKIEEMDDHIFSNLFILLDYKSIILLLKAKKIFKNKIESLLIRNQHTLHHYINSLDTVASTLTSNPLSALTVNYVIQLRRSINDIDNCYCCPVHEIDEQEIKYSTEKQIVLQSNTSCCFSTEREKRLCTLRLGCYIPFFLIFFASIPLLADVRSSKKNSEDRNQSFTLSLYIILVISLLTMGATAVKNYFTRSRQIALAHQAQDEPNQLVEKLSGYNPTIEMKYLIARSRLYAKLSSNDASKELTINEWKALPNLFKMYLLYLDIRQKGIEQYSVDKMIYELWTRYNDRPDKGKHLEKLNGSDYQQLAAMPKPNVVIKIGSGAVNST